MTKQLRTRDVVRIALLTQAAFIWFVIIGVWIMEKFYHV